MGGMERGGGVGGGLGELATWDEAPDGKSLCCVCVCMCLFFHWKNKHTLPQHGSLSLSAGLVDLTFFPTHMCLCNTHTHTHTHTHT